MATAITPFTPPTLLLGSAAGRFLYDVVIEDNSVKSMRIVASGHIVRHIQTNAPPLRYQA